MLGRLFRRLFARHAAAPAGADTAHDDPDFPNSPPLAPQPEARDDTAAPAYPPDRFRILVVVNREGSVEHYYHFILGFVAPLLLRETPANGVTYLIRSCGPLDGLLAELAIDGLTVLPKQTWQALNAAGTLRRERVSGYDRPEFYDQAAFIRLRAIVLDRLRLADTDTTGRVLVIDRGPSPAAYQTDSVENPTSANLRRSVPNMAAVCDALDAAGLACTRVQLETSTLRDQVALFLPVRTLVAQHGAALVNMLWMQPGGHVVEIMPVAGKPAAFFVRLAEFCGHAYTAVPQASRHAPVEPEAVLRAVRQAVPGAGPE